MAQLKNPPVYYTLAQVTFNPVLALDGYLPAIQEGLRKNGFPDFATVETTIFRVPEDEKAPPQSELLKSYLFHNLEKTHGFSLGKDHLTFHSSDYGTFDRFSEQLLAGLKIVNDQLSLAYVDRIGVRYLDDVRASNGDELEKYLAPEVHGIGNLFEGAAYYNYSEFFGSSNEVNLRTRVRIQVGGLAFPPDIMINGLQVQKRFLKDQGIHAIIDNDGFVDERNEFALEHVRGALFRIHDLIGKAFYKIVTPYALERWDE